MSGIADEKYVALTTYKKDGTTKSLPVWIADFGGGQVGFTTSSSSYKVKRINNDSRVTVQPSNAKGEVKDGTEAVSGSASREDRRRVRALCGDGQEEVRHPVRAR